MYFYIHIPFCKSKCKYCKFISIPYKEKEVKKYLSFLKKEIVSYFREGKDKKIDSIYFGGGTPSILSVEQISDIIQVFKKYGKISPKTEITLETNPENLSEIFLNNLEKTGINRISVGVQSLNNNTLSEIGRANNSIIFEAFNNLEKSKFNNIGADFIIGLPYEKRFAVAKNIKNLLEKFSFIKHISLYFLEGKCPSSWQKISIKESNYSVEYLEAKKVLKTFGFDKYEISNFSRVGFQTKHNKAYWTHKNYKGFGLGSASFIDNKRFVNAKKFSTYYKGKIEDEEILSKKDLDLEKAMFGIRTKGIKLNQIKNKLKLDEFVKGNYVKIENGLVKLSDKGIILSDYILREMG